MAVGTSAVVGRTLAETVQSSVGREDSVDVVAVVVAVQADRRFGMEG